MQTETKPLWKVLNEKRTQGKWIFKNQGSLPDDEGRLLCLRSELNSGYISQFQQIGEHKNDAEANAQYTALAVNNLHLLAQALQDLLNEVKVGKLNIRKDFSLINAHAQASNALSRIS